MTATKPAEVHPADTDANRDLLLIVGLLQTARSLVYTVTLDHPEGCRCHWCRPYPEYGGGHLGEELRGIDWSLGLVLGVLTGVTIGGIDLDGDTFSADIAKLAAFAAEDAAADAPRVVTAR